MNGTTYSQTNWKWDASVQRKAGELTVSKDGLAVSRNTKAGQNPAIFATEAMTRRNNHFRIKIKRLGNWIGIGFAEASFVLSGSRTLGTQPGCINSSYFWQSHGLRKIQMHGEQYTEVKEINVGDKLDIVIDFDANKVYYFNNGELQGWILCSKTTLTEGTLYPCVDLSYGSEVRVRNNDTPTLNLHQTPFAYHWRWGTVPNRKANAIQVSKDGLNAFRKETPKGMNPAVMCTEPLTRTRSHFRVEVAKLGKWAGVGFCDEKFILNDSKTLGTQTQSVSSAYFYQNTGINRLQMHGEMSIDDAKSYSPGDLIDIKVDFDTNRIYFFHNEKLQGYIAPTQNILLEGKIFPCVDMSAGTSITLRNDDRPELDINQTIQKLTLKEDAQDWKRPAEQFPTTWRWDSSPTKKATVVELSNDNMMAKRSQGGNNPAVMTTEPLTRNSNYFVVEVIQLGNWVGVGIADMRFQLNGSKTLGQQTTGVNSSYFYQGSVKKLQMYGEKSIPDRDMIRVGDLIAVKVDFDTNCIYYFNNDVQQGVIRPTKAILQEGKVFPCIDLSSGTTVSIRNVDSMPLPVAFPKTYY